MKSRSLFFTFLILVCSWAWAQTIPFGFLRSQSLTSFLDAGTTLWGRDIVLNRPSGGCTTSTTGVMTVFQAFRVSKTGVYNVLSTQSLDGFLTIQRDYADPTAMTTSCIGSNDDYNNSGGIYYSFVTVLLEADRDYFAASSNYGSGSTSMNFTTRFVGPGTVTELSPRLTNTAPQMIPSGGNILLKGVAKADTTAIAIYDDKLCINKINSGAEDLATFTSTGLQTAIATGIVTLYARLTDSVTTRVCTPVGTACSPPTTPIPVTNLVASPSASSDLFQQGPSFSWTGSMSSPCGGFEYQTSIGTTSGGTEYIGWSSSGTSVSLSSFQSVWLPGTYYFNVRARTTSNSAVSSVLTLSFTQSMSPNGVSFSGALNSSDGAYSRPNANGVNPPTSTQASPVYYEVKSFTVDTTGTYRLGTRFGWDAYTILYQNAFDPLQPLLNVMIANDDYGTSNATYNSYFSATLTAGVTYYYVVAAYAAAGQGPFTTLIDGPGVITLNP